MSGVQILTVASGDADQRLDRWFKQHFPTLGHGRLEKMLRKGHIRVDGKRAKAAQRLEEGQAVRVPPIPPAASEANIRPGERAREKTAPLPPDPELVETLTDAILYKDDEVLILNKPAGLAVQGGSKTQSHLDGALDELRFGAPDRPRLVHRLDRHTSGVLVLARTVAAARWLTAAFRAKETTKVYWAVVVGDPQPDRGTIELPLAKRSAGSAGEKVVVDRREGKRAVTEYAVIERLGTKAAWVALRPVTGRTHQLRVHMTEIGTPILGDGKYGGGAAFLDVSGLEERMHLHAREISLTRPNGTVLTVSAPLPEHMQQAWSFLGFDAPSGDPVARDMGWRP